REATPLARARRSRGTTGVGSVVRGTRGTRSGCGRRRASGASVATESSARGAIIFLLAPMRGRVAPRDGDAGHAATFVGCPPAVMQRCWPARQMRLHGRRNAPASRPGILHAAQKSLDSTAGDRLLVPGGARPVVSSPGSRALRRAGGARDLARRRALEGRE